MEVLYEILIIYFSNFLNSINENLDFFVIFIIYNISKYEFYNVENGLNMIKDLEILIIALEKQRSKLFINMLTLLPRIKTLFILIL